MRTLASGLSTHVQGEVLTLAVCARVTTRGNPPLTLGFTDLDRDLVFEGVVYEAEGALDASAVRAQVGTGVDNLDAQGLIRSDLITEADLLAGRWDGAAIEVFVVDWSQEPITERVVLVTGNLGTLELSRGQWKTEVRSLMAHLGQQIGDLVTPTCNVKRFGDARCGKDLTALRHTRTVAAVTSSTVLRFGGDSLATGLYDGGMVTFTSGENADIEKEVKRHEQQAGEAVLTLHEPFPYAVAVGDTAVLEEGCLRRFEDCERHSNQANFRGFPKLPQQDRVLQIQRR